ncbi:hypothetical protein GCM10022206_54160 [Streptomyces chiangmaiensis]
MGRAAGILDLLPDNTLTGNPAAIHARPNPERDPLPLVALQQGQHLHQAHQNSGTPSLHPTHNPPHSLEWDAGSV